MALIGVFKKKGKEISQSQQKRLFYNIVMSHQQKPVSKAQMHKSIASKIQYFDMFKHPFRFQLPNGFSSVRSIPGIISTYLVIILTIAYGTLNLIELSEYGKTTMRFDVIDYYYGDTDTF